MAVWADFYERLFNFREIRYFDIEGKQTGLFSKAMTSPCGKIRIPLNESQDDKSQIEEFLREYKGEGIQHIALGTTDIYEAVDILSGRGVAFQDTPDTYYELLPERIKGHEESIPELEKRGIMMDGAPTEGQGLLLQIFTQNVIGPIFFEIIQRKGNEGFGEGNFKALFEIDRARPDAKGCPLTEAYICDYIRTPIGRYGGALAQVRADDLAAIPIKALIERNPGVDWSELDDVILGCANQAGEDNRNLARMAGLLAGLPESSGGVTLNRLCGSGLDAVAMAARAIRSGESELIIAGGSESMSRAPFVMAKATSAFDRNAEMYDTTIGWRFVNPKMKIGLRRRHDAEHG